MTPAGTIARLRADMQTAWHLFRHDEIYRRRVEREEFHQAAYDEAQRKGLIERVEPRPEVR